MLFILIALAVVVALFGFSLLWSGSLLGLPRVARLYAFLLAFAVTLGLHSWLFYQAKRALPFFPTVAFGGVVLILIVLVLLRMRGL